MSDDKKNNEHSKKPEDVPKGPPSNPGHGNGKPENVPPGPPKDKPRPTDPPKTPPRTVG